MVSTSGDPAEQTASDDMRAFATALRPAQRAAHEYALSIGLFSGAQEIAKASRHGRQYVVATKLALIHTEVSEALEEIRSEQTDLGLPSRPTDDPLSRELADIVIRTMELAEDLGIDLGATILAKTEETRRRYRHGGLHF